MKPIIMTTESVRAILDGKKIQTRRVVKLKYNDTVVITRTDKYGTQIVEIQKETPPVINADGTTTHKIRFFEPLKLPYKSGDVLWVRETWVHHTDSSSEDYFIYKADDKYSSGWESPIYMPREAARIFLRVKDVRVERVQDITDEDAKSEGANWVNGENVGFEEKMRCGAIDRYHDIWDKINGKRKSGIYAWDNNPWVWVITFEQIDTIHGEEKQSNEN